MSTFNEQSLRRSLILRSELTVEGRQLPDRLDYCALAMKHNMTLQQVLEFESAMKPKRLPPLHLDAEAAQALVDAVLGE